MNILAIDPGLDITGVAVFDLEAYRQPSVRPEFDRAMATLKATAAIETRASERGRFGKIALAIHDLTVEWAPCVLSYIERPTIEGQYQRSGRMSRSGVNRMYEARGAVMAALEMGRVPVLELRAVTMPKEKRHALLEQVARHVGINLPRGARGGVPGDVWDAIWLGIQALGTRVDADLRSLQDSL